MNDRVLIKATYVHTVYQGLSEAGRQSSVYHINKHSTCRITNGRSLSVRQNMALETCMSHSVSCAVCVNGKQRLSYISLEHLFYYYVLNINVSPLLIAVYSPSH